MTSHVRFFFSCTVTRVTFCSARAGLANSGKACSLVCRFMQHAADLLNPSQLPKICVLQLQQLQNELNMQIRPRAACSSPVPESNPPSVVQSSAKVLNSSSLPSSSTVQAAVLKCPADDLSEGFSLSSSGFSVTASNPDSGELLSFVSKKPRTEGNQRYLLVRAQIFPYI